LGETGLVFNERRQRPGKLATHPRLQRFHAAGDRPCSTGSGYGWHPEKTQVVHIDDGFTFLGFDIRRMRKRGTTKQYVYTKPSKEAIPVDQGQGLAQDIQVNPPR
jgi:hypothetical protein